MLMVISPAKTLDMETPSPIDARDQPELIDHASELVAVLREKDAAELSRLMSMSARLGELNWQRFQDWQAPFDAERARPAVRAFRGDVYTGLDADSMDADDLAFAQRHLRILSGLYGLLRPLDLMQAYRLEMGTRLATDRGANLYEFWGGLITEALQRQLVELGSSSLVHLASEEYFKAVQPGALAAEVIQPVFQDRGKDQQYRVIAFHAKRARGRMAAWAIRQRIDQADGLKEFSEDGYRYQPEASTAWRWVFRRDQAD